MPGTNLCGHRTNRSRRKVISSNLDREVNEFMHRLQTSADHLLSDPVAGFNADDAGMRVGPYAPDVEIGNARVVQAAKKLAHLVGDVVVGSVQ